VSDFARTGLHLRTKKGAMPFHFGLQDSPTPPEERCGLQGRMNTSNFRHHERNRTVFKKELWGERLAAEQRGFKGKWSPVDSDRVFLLGGTINRQSGNCEIG
jgi:hypothetical protein